MHLLFAAGFSNEFFRALCWTLIHSLWQGLIASIIAAVIIMLTRRSSASLRYNLLITLLLLFVISISITAFKQFHTGTVAIDSSATSLGNLQTSVISFEQKQADVSENAEGLNLSQNLSLFFNEHASTIVLVWFLFFLIKCGQLVAGLQYIHRIRCRNNYEVSLYWKNRLVQLAEKTGIRRSLIFLESELVKVPAVIGFLQPALLVPMGLLSNLPLEQVEAILLHELAHIRRSDFLVNLLQSFLETFFFFNPAIVWISSLVREEREACCDDMVIANLPQKGNYLQALLSFQELHLHIETHAMALTGKQNYLFNRVKRMLTHENKKLNLMEKTTLLLGIMAITAFGFITKETKENAPAVTNKEVVKPLTKEVQSTTETPVLKMPVIKEKKSRKVSLPVIVADTLPKTNAKQDVNEERKFPSISSSTNNDGSTITSSIEATDNTGKQYKIKRVDGKITELVADGKIVPESQYNEYNEVIRQIDETQRQNTIKRKEKMELRKAEMVSRRKELMEKKTLLAKENQKERMEKRELRLDSMKMYNFKKAEDGKLFKQKNELAKKEYNKNKEEVLQKQKIFRDGRKTNDDVSRIIADLNNQKLISDADNLSFNLTNNELVVNGKKQPAEVHQQFKEKYIQKSGDRFNYSKNGSTTSITINRD